jgi:transglutaminase-like putative cysteine protease
LKQAPNEAARYGTLQARGKLLMRGGYKVNKIFSFLLILVMAGMVGVSISADTGNNTTSTLSLGEVVSPKGTVSFVIEGAPYTRYLRKAIGIDYDENGWHLQKIAEVKEFLISADTDGEPVSPETEFLSRKYRDFNRDMLNNASVLNLPQYLDVPENVSERVKSLSQSITAEKKTPFQKARAIEKYLQVKFDYNLDFETPPELWEPNDWFLFESKEGICGNFNSAFVILARAAGIPARLATGYYLPPSNEESQPVYSYQAHAWAEIGFEDIGWIAFEATPA